VPHPQAASSHTDGRRCKRNRHHAAPDDIWHGPMAACARHAPLREEPKPSSERHRSCVCAFKRAPLSAGRNHALKSPGGLLVPGDTGGNGTLARRWRQRIGVDGEMVCVERVQPVADLTYVYCSALGEQKVLAAALGVGAYALYTCTRAPRGC